MGCPAEVLTINHQGGNGVRFFVICVKLVEILLDGWISCLCTLHKSINHAFHASSIDLGRISVLSILELKDLVFNDVFEVLVNLSQHCCLNEIESLRVELS